MDAKFFAGELDGEEEQEGFDLADRLLAAGSTFDWITPVIGGAGDALAGWKFFNVPAEYTAEMRWALQAYGLAPCNEMLLGWGPDARYTFYVEACAAETVRGLLAEMGVALLR